MFSGKPKKKNVDFLLQSKHYEKLHLILYGLTVLLLLLMYIIFLFLISNILYRNILYVLFSLSLGLYLVFNRDELVKNISNQLDEIKRKEIKKNDMSNLKTTLRKIAPKNKNLKLNIKGKTPLKDRINSLKRKYNKKSKDPDYIEIED